jgi:hypothetical protein
MQDARHLLEPVVRFWFHRQVVVMGDTAKPHPGSVSRFFEVAVFESLSVPTYATRDEGGLC